MFDDKLTGRFFPDDSAPRHHENIVLRLDAVLQRGIPFLKGYIDQNSFFISVERLFRKELRNTPAAVVKYLDSETGVAGPIISPSYEAKAFGVRTGMDAREARRLCPNIKFVESRPEVYEAYHAKIFGLVARRIGNAHAHSIDEFAFELPVALRSASCAQEVADDIKHHLATELGEPLTASIGIGPNICLAKMASDMMKPNGLTILTDDYPRELAGLELQDFLYVGPSAEKKLNAKGITTVTGLFNASRAHLVDALNDAAGNFLYEMIRGDLKFDYRGDRSSVRSLGNSKTLSPPFRTSAGFQGAAQALAEKTLSRLRGRNLVAEQVTVEVAFLVRERKQWITLEQSIDRLPPSNSYPDWLHLIGSATSGMSEQARNLIPWRVDISFGKLSELGQAAASFYDGEASDRNETISKVVDVARNKFGDGRLRFGGSLPAKKEKISSLTFGPPEFHYRVKPKP